MPVEVPEGAWVKIEKRIELKERGEAAMPSTGNRQRIWTVRTIVTMIGAAAALVAICVLLLQASELAASNKIANDQIVRLLEQRDALKAEAERAGQLQTRVADLERQVLKNSDDNKKMLVLLDQAQQNYVEKIEKLMHADQYAVAPSQDKSAKGTLFWNKGDGTWTLMASNLTPLPAGKTFELWIITAKGEKIAAGTFDATPAGTAMHEMKLPADVGPIQLAAVTDEPIGGVEKPTGQILFLSDVTKKQ